MKKITNVEVRLNHLYADDIIVTSNANAPRFGTQAIGSSDEIGISARGYYEDEEDF